jgi:hypothetical protein
MRSYYDRVGCELELGENEGVTCARIGQKYPRKLRWKRRQKRDAGLLSDCGTCYWSLDSQDIALCAKELRRLLNDIYGMLLLYAALVVKVVFQKREVGFGLVRF